MFEGEKVRLRSVELSDLDKIMEVWNNLKLRKYLASPLPFARDEEEQWIRNTWVERRKGTGYQFAVDDKVTNEFIGGGGLFGINNFTRSAELGIAIYAEKNWGKGYGTDIMKVLLRFGFDFLNLNRIQLRVVDYNIRGIKTYKKVGFKEVGKFRQTHYWEGKYYDHILMDILREEWMELNKKEEK
jgi:RimJ/RimL family protein N-acetyltransferase